MTELAGATTDDVVKWNGTAWIAGVGGGSAMPTVQTFIAPGTYTKPATIKGIKVTVVGAGGNTATAVVPGGNARGGGGGGGAAIEFIPAPSIPGPVAVTAGPGTNSFGAFCSATAGSSSTTNSGAVGGMGSGADINIKGGAGDNAVILAPTLYIGGLGGSSILGGGGAAGIGVVGSNGGDYGGGGGGSARIPVGTTAGTTGASGIVIVEEFY